MILTGRWPIAGGCTMRRITDLPFINRLALLMLTALLPLCLAMGGSDSGPTSIPEPSKVYKVIMVDQQGMTSELDNFAIGGGVFVFGELGKGQVAIAFDKIKSLELVTVDKQTMAATVNLRQGKAIKLNVKAATAATGKTSYGNFRIKLREVSAIRFIR